MRVTTKPMEQADVEPLRLKLEFKPQETWQFLRVVEQEIGTRCRT
jgi:hypothetical protein